MDPSSVGDTLHQIRLQRRISQKDLAQLSGVSHSAVKLIETGYSKPKPATLRLLARGLAMRFNDQVDDKALEEIYARLMRASGYWPQPVAEATEATEEPGVNREAFLREMEERHGEPIAVALSTVAWDKDKLPLSFQRLIDSALLALSENTPDEERPRNSQ